MKFSTYTILFSIFLLTAHQSHLASQRYVMVWERGNCHQCRERGDRHWNKHLCETCMFKAYPDQFAGCLFCRKPRLITRDGIQPTDIGCSAFFVRKLLSKVGLQEEYERDWCKGICLKSVEWVFKHVRSLPLVCKKSIPSFVAFSDSRRNTFKNKEDLRLYRGAALLPNGNKLHVWVNDIDDVAIPVAGKLDSEEQKKEYIRAICNIPGIFGPETGEIILDAVPENASATYEEVLQQ